MGNSAPTTFKKTSDEQPLGPPRFTGDWQTDQKQMANWIADFVRICVVETGLLDPTYQKTIGEISFDKLPDPGATTIARAQATANAAWEAGETFKADLETALKTFVFGGSFTITGAANQGNPVFTYDIGTTDYHAVVTPTGATGAPANDAFRVIQIGKGTGGIAVIVAGAPGVGNSVTYDYIIVGPTPNLTTRNDEEA